MNIHRLLLLLLLCGAMVHAKPPRPSPTPAPAPPSATPTPETKAAMDALRKPYDAALLGLDAEMEKARMAADGWYLTNLEKLQGQIAKTGDLDGAVAVKNEHARIAAHQATSAEQLQAMAAPLRTLRGEYDAALKKDQAGIDQRKASEGRKQMAALEVLQKKITMTGDIEQALLVKAEKERIAASLADSAPKIASAPGTPGAAAPAATPSVGQTDLSKAPDPKGILVGSWVFTYEQTGARSTRRFMADGTMIAEGFKLPGHWSVSDNKIVLMYSTGVREDMHLPLDPAGTRVYAARGKVIKAVKVATKG